MRGLHPHFLLEGMGAAHWLGQEECLHHLSCLQISLCLPEAAAAKIESTVWKWLQLTLFKTNCPSISSYLALALALCTASSFPPMSWDRACLVYKKPALEFGGKCEICILFAHTCTWQYGFLSFSTC